MHDIAVRRPQAAGKLPNSRSISRLCGSSHVHLPPRRARLVSQGQGQHTLHSTLSLKGYQAIPRAFPCLNRGILSVDRQALFLDAHDNQISWALRVVEDRLDPGMADNVFVFS